MDFVQPVGNIPHYQSSRYNGIGYPPYSLLPMSYPSYPAVSPVPVSWRYGYDPYGHYRTTFWHQSLTRDNMKTAYNQNTRQLHSAMARRYPANYLNHPTPIYPNNLRTTPYIPVPVPPGSSIVGPTYTGPQQNEKMNHVYASFIDNLKQRKQTINNFTDISPFSQTESVKSVTNSPPLRPFEHKERMKNPANLPMLCSRPIQRESVETLPEGLSGNSSVNLNTNVTAKDESRNEKCKVTITQTQDFTAHQQIFPKQSVNDVNFTPKRKTSAQNSISKRPLSLPVKDLMNKLLNRNSPQKKISEPMEALVDTNPSLALDLLDQECSSRFRGDQLNDSITTQLDLKMFPEDGDLEELIMMDTQLDNILEFFDKVENVNQSFEKKANLSTEKTSKPKMKKRGRKKIRHFCVLCGKNFTCKANKTVHMRIHSGERPFQCDFCEKSFKQRSTLATHTRVHTGDKPYACSQCHRAFTDYSSWQKHLRLHSGEKPFACDICKKRFTQAGNRDRHVKTHEKRKVKEVKR